MPTFWQRLFPTPEVMIVLSAYHDEIGKIGNVNGGSVVGSIAGIGIVNEEIKSTIHAGRDTIKQKIAAGKPPRVLVLLIISNLVYRHVTSGQYHTYRGFLSLQGKSLHILWHYTVNELEKAGELSTKDRQLAEQDLREVIKGIG